MLRSTPSCRGIPATGQIHYDGLRVICLDLYQELAGFPLARSKHHAHQFGQAVRAHLFHHPRPPPPRCAGWCRGRGDRLIRQVGDHAFQYLALARGRLATHGATATLACFCYWRRRLA
jgi:hypothetical protein